MMTAHGLWWPDDTPESAMQHALEHVKSVRWAITHCSTRRLAVQAGGNVGLWPRKLAEKFQRVITFEPDAHSRACLAQNVPASVEIRREALGERAGRGAVKHRGLGSHRMVDGDDVSIIALDSLELSDLDFLQLDIEGYEWHALAGARATVARCRPLIQVELRGFVAKYGKTAEEVRALLAEWGYVEQSTQPGSDVVFAHAAQMRGAA